MKRARKNPKTRPAPPGSLQGVLPFDSCGGAQPEPGAPSAPPATVPPGHGQGPADARPERSTPDGVMPEASCETAASSKPPASLVPPVSRILAGSSETSAKNGTTTQGRKPLDLPGVPADGTVASPFSTAINSAVVTTQRREAVERPSTPASRMLDGSWSGTLQDAAGAPRVDQRTWRDLLPLLRGLCDAATR